MTAPTSLKVGLPSTGAVLAFMVDCLGIPKDGDSYGYKDLERLRKGGLSPESHWAVARTVMETIVALFLDGKAAKEAIDTVLKQQAAAPITRIHWQMKEELFVPVPELATPHEAVTWTWNADGELQNLGEHLVQDWIEFLGRHEFLGNQCGWGEKLGANVLFHWTCVFVVPFLAANLMEYQRNDSGLESGMPGGRFWYLPQMILPEATGDKPQIKWPVNFVLEWWEDLLGVSFEAHADWLCAPGQDRDNARRQVRAWCRENRPPDQATIARWCKISWEDKYAGTFADDCALSLDERWKHSRTFLIRKGLHDPFHNWLENLRGSPGEMYREQYRGERLELEILPFREVPFATFFESPDPVAAGLPVGEFVKRVAERYARPTNEQLKARLTIAAAFQRAFTQVEESFGLETALRINELFQQVYCLLMDLHNRAEPETRQEVLRLLRAAPQSQDGLRLACEWLFDEGSWLRLPAVITALVES